MTQQLSGFPKHRVIGTGTSLDTARLNVLLSEKLNVPVNEIDALVLGEHGDTSFGAFDEATINGKGATFYGVAKYLTYIVKTIIENRNIMLPISAPLTGQYGINDLYLGMPAIVNRTGIEKVIDYGLSDTEIEKLKYSAAKMKDVLDGVEV